MNNSQIREATRGESVSRRVTTGGGEGWKGIQTDSLRRDDFCEHIRKTAKKHSLNSRQLVLCPHSQSVIKTEGV